MQIHISRGTKTATAREIQCTLCILFPYMWLNTCNFKSKSFSQWEDFREIYLEEFGKKKNADYSQKLVYWGKKKKERKSKHTQHM